MSTKKHRSPEDAIEAQAARSFTSDKLDWMTALSGHFSGIGHKPAEISTCWRRYVARFCQAALSVYGLKFAPS